ncbi:MAG: ATP-binding protein [Rhodospirillales bacterium]|nr:ATP-binding protein [Rhodospirillales bacterium]
MFGSAIFDGLAPGLIQGLRRHALEPLGSPNLAQSVLRLRPRHSARPVVALIDWTAHFERVDLAALEIDCCLDAGLSDLPPGLEPALAGSEDGVTAALTTLTAYRRNVAQDFLDWTVRRGPRLSEDHRVILRQAMQEALANAVLHGNLGLRNLQSVSVESYSDYLGLIQERLGARLYAGRPVVLAARWRDRHLTIAVEDSGRGFDLARSMKPVPATARGGRGLAIIHGLADRVRLFNEGRRIEMDFALDQDSTA